MKKILFAISLCLLTLSASAQLKVQSDGKIAIQTTSTALSPISINGAGYSNYYIGCDVPTGKNGILLYTHGGIDGDVIGGEFNAFSNR